jgi:hypothetical protein
MYCPSCGNEATVELKYCNRCGANLTSNALQPTTVFAPPVKLTLPGIILGLTIVGGLGIIFATAAQFALLGMPAVAIVWIVLLGLAALFGSVLMLIRFWTKLISMQREGLTVQPQVQTRPSAIGPTHVQQLPPRLEPVPSVTENTTRTFSPVYSDPADRGTR